MVRLTCGCGAKSSQLPKKIEDELLAKLTRETKLKPAEVKTLYARFRKLAPQGFLGEEQFRQTMGMLGLVDDAFLPRQLFRVFDEDGDGRLSFEEFASSLAVMIRGTEDEKLTLSFEMAAGHRNAASLQLEDFQQLIKSCNTIMSSLVESSPRHISSTTDEETRRLFTALAGLPPGTGKVELTLEAYKEAARSSEEFLGLLGLEPSRLKGSVGPNGNVSLSTPRRQLSRPSAQRAINQAQLEDLAERITAVKRSLRDLSERHRPYSSPREQKAVPVQPQAPEPWLLALPFAMCCRAPGSVVSEVAELVESSTEDRDERIDEDMEHVISQLDEVIGQLPRTGPQDCACETPTGGRLGGQYPPGIPEGEVTITGFRSTYPTEASVGAETGSVNASRHPTAGPTKTWRHKLLGPKKGLAVHFGHENWNMVLSMMIGIRMSVGRSRTEIAREVQPVDFIMKEKFSIIPRLANFFDSTVSKRVTLTRFVDYAPLVFQRIRANFGIHAEDYLRSVGPDQLFGNMILGNLSSLSELSSEGKSGAFFYYTADNRFMLKTVSPKEHQGLKQMLKQYYYYITENPGTLIVRFLGLHCLRLKRRKGTRRSSKRHDKLYFVVMGNMFNTPFEINRRYDLKGSWVGRFATVTPGEKAPVLKDENFRQEKESIKIGNERRGELLEQIQRDSKFLCGLGIIDYSLLLGVCEVGVDGVPGDAVQLRESMSGNTDAGDGSPRTSRGIRRWASLESERSIGCQEEVTAVPVIPSAGSLDTEQFSPRRMQPPRLDATAQRRQVPLHQRCMGGMLSSDRSTLYYLGIIDILTLYDTSKKIEHYSKALVFDRRGVSCCPPAMYADRFNKMMDQAIS